MASREVVVGSAPTEMIVSTTGATGGKRPHSTATGGNDTGGPLSLPSAPDFYPGFYPVSLGSKDILHFEEFQQVPLGRTDSLGAITAKRPHQGSIDQFTARVQAATEKIFAMMEYQDIPSVSQSLAVVECNTDPSIDMPIDGVQPAIVPYSRLPYVQPILPWALKELKQWQRFPAADWVITTLDDYRLARCNLASTALIKEGSYPRPPYIQSGRGFFFRDYRFMGVLPASFNENENFTLRHDGQGYNGIYDDSSRNSAPQRFSLQVRGEVLLNAHFACLTEEGQEQRFTTGDHAWIYMLSADVGMVLKLYAGRFTKPYVERRRLLDQVDPRSKGASLYVGTLPPALELDQVHHLHQLALEYSRGDHAFYTRAIVPGTTEYNEVIQHRNSYYISA